MAFERVRDELRRGASARRAVKEAFAKTFRPLAEGQLIAAAASLAIYSLGPGRTAQSFGLILLIAAGTTLVTSIGLSDSASSSCCRWSGRPARKAKAR